MKRPRRVPWLIAILSAAMVVESVNALGWWQWHRLGVALEGDREAGVSLLGSDPMLALPSTVFRSRRLEGSKLWGAEVPSIIAALKRVGELQIKWFPSEADGYKYLARAVYFSGDRQGAQEIMTQALIREPTSPYLHRLFALMLRHSGRLELALDHMAEAEGLAPGFRVPTIEILPEEQDWVRIEGLRRQVRLYPRNQIRSLIALATELRKQGDGEAARAELDGVDHPQVRIQLARWAIEEERPAEAIDLATPVAESVLYPLKMRVPAWSLIAQARDLSGDLEGAREAADKALALGPDSPAPYLALAKIAERRSDFSGALEYVRSARGVAPAEISVLVRFSRIADRAGHRKEAVQALLRATELAPERNDLAANLVEMYLRYGDYANATFVYGKFTDRFPTDTRLLRLGPRLIPQSPLAPSQPRGH